MRYSEALQQSLVYASMVLGLTACAQMALVLFGGV
jgi:hypothetical protein